MTRCFERKSRSEKRRKKAWYKQQYHDPPSILYTIESFQFVVLRETSFGERCFKSVFFRQLFMLTFILSNKLEFCNFVVLFVGGCLYVCWRFTYTWSQNLPWYGQNTKSKHIQTSFLNFLYISYIFHVYYYFFVNLNLFIKSPLHLLRSSGFVQIHNFYKHKCTRPFVGYRGRQ